MNHPAEKVSPAYTLVTWLAGGITNQFKDQIDPYRKQAKTPEHMGCCSTSVFKECPPPGAIHQPGYKLELHTKKDYFILCIDFKKMHDLIVSEMHGRLT